MDGQVLNFDM